MVEVEPKVANVPITDVPAWVREHQGGGLVDVVTVRRWAVAGVSGVRLKARRIGRRWWTDERSLIRFFAELNRQAD